MIDLILSMMNPTTVLVFVVVLLLAYYVITMPRMINMPPGPFPFPVIGNFLEMTKDPGENNLHIFQPLAKKYGKLFSLKLGSHYAVVINDYKLLVEAFVKKGDVFSNRPIANFYLMSYLNSELGSGIVTNDGHTWKQLRRIALIAMRDFGVGKQSLEEKVHEEVGAFLDCVGQNEGQPFNIKPLLNMATSNVTCGVIFGSRFDYEDIKFKKLLEKHNQSFAINVLAAPINYFPFLKYIPYFRESVHSFCHTMKATTEYIKELTADSEPTFDPENIRDFVDLFIQKKREHKDDDSFNERNLRRVIEDMFTAGSDSTATPLSWAMLYMAKYPDVQAQCQKQIDEVLGKARRVTMADKDKLPYVEATILEVMRCRPVSPVGLPHATSQKTELGGYHIPKDTIFFTNALSMYSDPETFPEPEKFKPDRFIGDDGKIILRDRMVSFSIGPRSCPGEGLARMELLFFFTSILQFFTVTPEPGVPIDMTPVVALVLRHNPHNLVFTRRD